MSNGIQWRTVVGQERIRETLSAAYMHGTLGHAYLFSGPDGSGKMALALELAMALLCGQGASTPCRTCESCRKVLNGSHPDLHCVLPVALEKEHKGSDAKLSEKGWAFLSAQIRETIADPYSIRMFKGIPAIPVEWVKEINHAILRGPVSGDRIVAIIDGIDIMNKESANALLKTLEEPPSGTHIFLLTDRLQAVLPTIISRCQVLRFGSVPDAEIRAALIERFGSGLETSVIDEAVHNAMGSLGRARYVCEQDAGDYAEVAQQLLTECRNGSLLDAAALVSGIEQHENMDYHRRLLMHIIFLIRSGFFGEILSTETYIDGGVSAMREGGTTTGTIVPVTTSTSAERLFNVCQDSLASIQAYGNTGLVWAHFIIKLTEILHGKQ